MPGNKDTLIFFSKSVCSRADFNISGKSLILFRYLLRLLLEPAFSFSDLLFVAGLLFASLLLRFDEPELTSDPLDGLEVSTLCTGWVCRELPPDISAGARLDEP